MIIIAFHWQSAGPVVANRTERSPRHLRRLKQPRARVPIRANRNYTAEASKNPKIAAPSDMHALSSGQFFVLARESGFGDGQSEFLSVYRHTDVFDISEATDISGDAYDCATCAVADSDGDIKLWCHGRDVLLLLRLERELTAGEVRNA